MKKLFEEKTISREPIFKGNVIEVEVQEVSLPDGKTSKRELVHHNGAVAVIAFNRDDELILVRQYRKALEKAIAEIPAGKLELGEDPLSSAKRELQEETGIRAGKWTELVSFYTSPGFANELVYVFLAEDLNEGEANPDDDEFVERVDVSLEEAKSMIRSGDIHDAKTVYAVQVMEIRHIR